MSRHLLGPFERAVMLVATELGDDAYGAVIRRELVRILGRDVAVGAIYTTLARLESKGYLRSFILESRPKRGGRKRRAYETTARGAAMLARFEQVYRDLASIRASV